MTDDKKTLLKLSHIEFDRSSSDHTGKHSRISSGTLSNNCDLSDICSAASSDIDLLDRELSSVEYSGFMHEIKNSLNNIYLLIQSLMMNEKIRKDATVLETFNIINASILSIKSLDADFDFYRKTGKSAIKRKYFNIVVLIRQILQEYEPICKEKNISITVDALGFYILSDYEKLKRIISNLVSNAIKYNKPNGKIDIIVKPGSVLDNKMQIIIKDTGIGMSADELHLIGKPFYRADKSSSIAGTGLGVAQIKKICRLFDWEFSFESELDKGTTATLKIK